MQTLRKRARYPQVCLGLFLVLVQLINENVIGNEDWDSETVVKFVRCSVYLDLAATLAKQSGKDGEWISKLESASKVFRRKAVNASNEDYESEIRLGELVKLNSVSESDADIFYKRLKATLIQCDPEEVGYPLFE